MDRFAYHLSIERQLSPNTVASYSYEVASFLEYYKGDPASCTPEDVSGYLATRASEIGKRSQAHALSALRCWFDYQILEGERKDNPCDKVDAPKLGRYLPEVLSVDEVMAILESVPLNTATGRSKSSWRKPKPSSTFSAASLRRPPPSIDRCSVTSL